MTKIHPIFKTLLVVCFTLTFVSIASAQSRTFVSGVGNDADPCSRTAPCRTFSGALSKTAVNGEINCLDPAPAGTALITKSITIDCHEMFASTLHPGISGFTISFDLFGVTDTRRTVRIRNINFQGNDSGTIGIRILGTGVSSANSEVVVEDCLIDGSLAPANPNGRGISDTRSGGGELYVTNTTIRNMGGSAVAIVPSSGATQIKVAINDTRIYNCAFGVVASSGSRITVRNSVVSGCTSAGFFAEGPGGASELHVNHSESSHNGTGVQQAAGGTVRVANSDFVNNTTAVAGTVLSFGNNRVSGGAGALTAIGVDSHDKGQQ